MPGYLDEVEKALLFRCPTLLMDWLPGGRQQGQYYSCANLSGGRGDSLKVYLTGSNAGKWADYAGDKGDAGSNLVSLYAAIKGMQWKEALHFLADMVGVQRQRQRTNWQVIAPAPETAYECDNNGDPMLPEIPNVKGNAGYWAYLDAEGRLLCFRFRMNKQTRNRDGKLEKDVLPLVWCRDPDTGEESWRVRDLPDPLPLYNLPALALAPEKILIVQGEKKAKAAGRLLPDWCVTTQPGGDKKVSKSDWSPVRRAEKARVVIWPDNDISGQGAATDVAEQLQRDVEVVRMDPLWPKAFDLADAEEMGWDTTRVESYLAQNVITVTKQKPQDRPKVDLSGKDLHRQMREIYEAMAEIKADVYNYSSGVVYVRPNIHGMLEVSGMEPKDFKAWAAKRLETRAYRGGVSWQPCVVSDDLANAVIFNAPGSIPNLKRFADLPVFTAGGKLLETSGYHPDSQVYVSVPKGYDPELPMEEAWGLIDGLLSDFPFETESDKTSAVAFVLTAILRDLIDGPTPIFRFEAPSPGTGKSLLCEALCEIVTPFPQEYDMPESVDELRKLLTTAIVRGSPVIRFDNVEKMESTTFKRATTSHTWGDRLLGANKEVNLPIRNLWAVTLNNPELSGETFRRTARVRLDAKMSNPESRAQTLFRHNPLIRYVRENRGILVSAFVAVAKAGIGESATALPAMGSYESWVSALAPVLETNSYGGFMANIEEDRESSLDTSGMREWKNLYRSG